MKSFIINQRGERETKMFEWRWGEVMNNSWGLIKSQSSSHRSKVKVVLPVLLSVGNLSSQKLSQSHSFSHSHVCILWDFVWCKSLSIWFIHVLVIASAGSFTCWSSPLLVHSRVGHILCWFIHMLVIASAGSFTCWSYTLLVHSRVGHSHRWFIYVLAKLSHSSINMLFRFSLFP